jgi:uncharacterized protein YggT (Ycf19 family)
MSKARHILAVVTVTAALCADQVVAAAPMSRPQVSDIAARLVERLSQPFRRVTPSVVRPFVRSRFATAQSPVPVARPVAVFTQPITFSPFQFRLPPPSL